MKLNQNQNQIWTEKSASITSGVFLPLASLVVLLQAVLLFVVPVASVVAKFLTPASLRRGWSFSIFRWGSRLGSRAAFVGFWHHDFGFHCWNWRLDGRTIVTFLLSHAPKSGHVFLDCVDPWTQHFVWNVLIVVEVWHVVQPVGFFLVAVPVLMSDSPTIIAKWRDPWVRNFNSFSANRQGVRNMASYLQLDWKIVDADVVFINRVAETM